MQSKAIKLINENPISLKDPEMRKKLNEQLINMHLPILQTTLIMAVSIIFITLAKIGFKMLVITPCFLIVGATILGFYYPAYRTHFIVTARIMMTFCLCWFVMDVFGTEIGCKPVE